MVLRHSESTTCQSTFLVSESSIEINFEFCLIGFFSRVDVSPIFADLVQIKER